MAGGVERTETLEAADNVDASAAVLARRRFAFVDVYGTRVACKSAAFANRPGASLLADAAIFARIGVAITAVFAAFATQTGRAFAPEVVVEIVATAVEKTRRRSARIAVDFATSAHETRPASTLVAGQDSGHLSTRATIQTRLTAADARPFEWNSADELDVGKPLQRNGWTGRSAVTGTETVQRGGRRTDGYVLWQEIIVQTDFIQAADEAHANIVHCPNFGTEEDVIANWFQVEDIVDTGSCSLRSIRSVYRHFSHASVTFHSDIVPSSVVDI